MNMAESLLRDGSLAASLEALHSDIRRRPMDGQLRVFCAQLLMLAGQWDGALSQLDAVGSLDAAALFMAHTYRGLIDGERVRAAVFAGQCSPGVVGGMQPWLAQLATCLSLERQGYTAQAAELRYDAFGAAPQIAGLLNGSAFESIADADSRLGPVLEVMLGGAYYWAPFACIKCVVIEGPRDARDFAWLPAQFLWRNGDRSTGFIPARYPGSERSDDDAIRLARKTHWQPLAADSRAGLGQRQLETNTTGAIGILDVTNLSLAPGADTAGSQDTEGEDLGEEFELTGE
jgi:type VI secretion system protein ImpE